MRTADLDTELNDLQTQFKAQDIDRKTWETQARKDAIAILGRVNAMNNRVQKVEEELTKLRA